MKVLKFGGSSLKNPSRMREVLNILLSQEAEKKIIVLSAIGGVTNQLQEIVNKLNKGSKKAALSTVESLIDFHQRYAQELALNDSSLGAVQNKIEEVASLLHAIIHGVKGNNLVDEKTILAQGEILSTQLFYALVQSHGISSTLLYAPTYIRLNPAGSPSVADITAQFAQHAVNMQAINILQGFICQNSSGALDNLQRGGSDYTASLVGAALDATEIQIWTDIDGFHNNDPRYVEGTQPVRHLHFDEAAELAYFGAKILHPQSIHPAKQKNIPVRLLNTMAPELEGTTISNRGNKENQLVAIAAKDEITAIRIHSSRMLMAYGFLRQVFEVFERYKTAIDMITTSEVAISLTIDDTRFLSEIVEDLSRFGKVEVDRNQSIVCVVGNLTAESYGIAHAVALALKDFPIRMISYGGSQHNISMLLPQEKKTAALRALHTNLFKTLPYDKGAIGEI